VKKSVQNRLYLRGLWGTNSDHIKRVTKSAEIFRSQRIRYEFRDFATFSLTISQRSKILSLKFGGKPQKIATDS